MDIRERTSNTETSRSTQSDVSNTERVSQFNRLAYGLGRRKLARNICTRINQSLRNKYFFIKDILPTERFEDVQGIIDSYNLYCTKTSQENINFIIGWHPKETQSHIHLYHVCKFHQSYCRCAYLNHIKHKFKRRRPQHIIRDCSLETEHIENIIEYLLTEKRQLVHIQINGESLNEQIHRLESLRSSISIPQYSTQRSVEMCELESENGSGKELSSIESNIEEIGGIDNFIGEGLSDISWDGAACNSERRKLKIIRYLVRNLLRYLTVPIEAACSTAQWMEVPLNTIFEAGNPEYKLAVNTIYKLTCNLDIHQIYKIHTTPGCIGLYSSTHPNYYYNQDDSLVHIETLLKHQYGDNITEFLNHLYEITEKKIPKKNSMFVLG